MNKGYLLGGAILIAVLVTAGVLLFNSNNKKTVTPTPTQIPLTETSDETLKVSDNAREISVSAFEMGFKLSSTTLKRGEMVRINLTNAGKFPHNFVLDEMPDVKTKVINPGESDVVEFTVPLTGDLTYYCSVGTHRARGMEGRFTIEE